MPGVADRTIELQLAETGSDLRAAIEAAQYARLVSQDEVSTRDELIAAARFVEAFATYAEAWEGHSETARRRALADLGLHLEALQRLGLFVHRGVVRRAVTTPEHEKVALPLAILTIGRSDPPTRLVLLPAALGIAAETAAPRH